MSDEQGELLNQLAEAILTALSNALGEIENKPAIEAALADLVPSLLSYALEYGVTDMQAILDRLTKKNDQADWRKLIDASSPDNRVKIMEAQRQQAIAETLAKISRDKAEYERWLLAWNVIKAFIPMLLAMIVAL